MLSFANPLGFLALLALPIIFAIHFLQRESRRVLTSTLFLLEQLAPESAQGRRFERLRNSVPLWLQIIAALLVTWLLIEPRWIRRDSTQHVVIVLDSSVSMLAFEKEMMRALDTQTAKLNRAGARTEWQLLESDTTRPTLYSGGDRAALLSAAEKWKPHLGTHDFNPAIEIAQRLLRGTGTLIFVSDRRCPLPEEVRLLAVGHPLENCGFAGANFSGTEWKALVRNYGRVAQHRTWWMEAKGERSPANEITIEPGQTLALNGAMPAGVTACELVLSGDSFTLDDRLPLVLPRPKHLQIAVQPSTPLADFFAQFVPSFDAIDNALSPPDLRLNIYDPFAPGLPGSTAIVFVSDPTASTKFLPGNVVAENNALTSDLNWSGLLCRDSLHVPAQLGDETLIWQGDRPLIFLRQIGSASLLVINFDLQASNATRLPAFILLLHRFVEQIRMNKVAPESRNVDTNQLLTVASDPSLPPPTMGDETSATLRAPAEPKFFQIKQGDKILLDGAAQFADARESDFRDAATIDGLGDAIGRLVARNSESDFLAPLWMLALGGVMIASWIWRQS